MSIKPVSSGGMKAGAMCGMTAMSGMTVAVWRDGEMLDCGCVEWDPQNDSTSCLPT